MNGNTPLRHLAAQFLLRPELAESSRTSVWGTNPLLHLKGHFREWSGETHAGFGLVSAGKKQNAPMSHCVWWKPKNLQSVCFCCSVTAFWCIFLLCCISPPILYMLIQTQNHSGAFCVYWTLKRLLPDWGCNRKFCTRPTSCLQTRVAQIFWYLTKSSIQMNLQWL